MWKGKRLETIVKHVTNKIETSIIMFTHCQSVRNNLNGIIRSQELRQHLYKICKSILFIFRENQHRDTSLEKGEKGNNDLRG